MSKWAKIAFLIGGISWLALLLGLLFGARRWALSEMNTPQSHADWSDWREEVREQGQGKNRPPVHRRIPKSSEPPVLLLMRDHFGVCLAGTVVFGTVLYGTLALFTHGAIGRR